MHVKIVTQIRTTHLRINKFLLWLFLGWFAGKPERLAYPIESSGRICGQKYRDLDTQ